MATALCLIGTTPAQAQSIECTFISKKDNRTPLNRWTVKLGREPYVHHWEASTSYSDGEDVDRQVVYAKHAKATNTAVVIVKANYVSKFPDLRSGASDFDDYVLLIDFAKNSMVVTVAEQAADPDARSGSNPPVRYMDVCKRLD